MLDKKYVADHISEVETNCRRRNVKVDIRQIANLYSEMKRKGQERDELVSEQRKLEHEAQFHFQKAQKEKATAGSPLTLNFRDWLHQSQRKDAERLNELKDRIKSLEFEKSSLEAPLEVLLRQLPNMTHPDAPVGTLAEDNKVIKVWGEKPKFDFKPKDHLAVAEGLDLIDMEAGAKVAGQKFYFLKNEAVLLELALIQYAFDVLLRHGYSPIITPDVARVDVLEGIGFMPRGEGTQIYSLANTDLCLIATAEITLGGMHRDQIMEEAKLPIKYVGLSHCFRTEAGAPGRDTRGIYRVHQFTKVEMFAYCGTEDSEAIHQEILGIEEEIFQGLGLPYHVIDTCTGDLGGPAYRKYDLEAWMPGRGDAGEYGEVTSTSNCTDFQARRLNIRYKSPKFKGTRFVHTLNGTAVAISRALVAVLENYQQADGSVIVPEKLRLWMRGQERIGPK